MAILFHCFYWYIVSFVKYLIFYFCLVWLFLFYSILFYFYYLLVALELGTNEFHYMCCV